MRTLRLIFDPNNLDAPVAMDAIETAARILRDGGTVAFPTETVYGLGANALSAEAVQKIFVAKQRPSWDPVIVHIAEPDMLDQVAHTSPPGARMLMDAYWPGPLTLLLPRHAQIPEIVTAGRPRVGVRMPAHPVARVLIRAAGLPIAAPSANTFGHTSPTSAQHVADDLDGRIDAILEADGDVSTPAYGLESTVVDVCDDPWVVYRPGAVTLGQIRAISPSAVAYDDSTRAPAAEPAALPSPGVGLRHYAPRARLILVEDSPDQLSRFGEIIASLAGARVGLMLPDPFSGVLEGQDAAIYPWGDWNEPEELARKVFAGLRWLDSQGAAVIVCPLPAATGIGIAIRDRLKKAARTK